MIKIQNILSKIRSVFKKQGYELIVVALVIAIMCFIIPLSYNVSVAVSAKYPTSTDWGLSFRENGKQPVGNETSDYLKQFDSYFVGKPEEKTIYLTFDAGFENGNTPKILDTLKKQKVSAAFFLVNHFLTDKPELVKRMVSEGHIVANHTANHPNMSKISDMENFKKELDTVEQTYKALIGKPMPKFYRPPQGKFCESNLKQAQTLGYKTIFWSLAYVDWDEKNQPTVEYAKSKLNSRIHSGAVILLHSTSKTNAEALDELITGWKKDGYTFKTLDDLVK